VNNQLCTRFDAAGPALVITDLTVTDPAIIAESRRWSTGQRGPNVGPAELLEIDLSPFVRRRRCCARCALMRPRKLSARLRC
jgi:hypothetical protein